MKHCRICLAVPVVALLSLAPVGPSFGQVCSVGDWTLTPDAKAGGTELAFRGRRIASNVAFSLFTKDYKKALFPSYGYQVSRDGSVVTLSKSNESAVVAFRFAFAPKSVKISLDAEVRTTNTVYELAVNLPLKDLSVPGGEPFVRLRGDYHPIPREPFPNSFITDISFDLPEAKYVLQFPNVGLIALHDIRSYCPDTVSAVTTAVVTRPYKVHREATWRVDAEYDAAVAAARAKMLARPVETMRRIDVANAGAEEDAAGWAMPPNASVATNVAHSGTRSFCLATDEIRRSKAYITRQIPVKAGGQYVFTCYLKHENVKDEKRVDIFPVGAGLIVEWADKSGKWCRGGREAVYNWGTSDWKKLTVTGLTAPADAGYAVVFLTLRGTGRAWYDDLEMYEVSSPVDKTEPAYGATLRSNTPHFAWKPKLGVRRYSLVLSPDPAFPKEKVRTYDVGGVCEYRLEEPLEAGAWHWKVTSSGCDDDALPFAFEQTAPKDADCLPPQVKTPAARVTDAGGTFTLRVKDASKERPQVEVRFGGRTYRGAFASVAADGLLEYAFWAPAGGWPRGFAEGESVATDGAGNVERRPFWFLNAPKPANDVRIDADGRYREAGKRIFPLGIYEVEPKYMREVRAGGWDVVHLYRWESSQDDAACRTFLDQCWAADGLRAFVGFDRGCPSGLGIVDGEFAPVARRVGALADHPGLFCWYLFDEPEVANQFVAPDQLVAFADLVRALDPYHAVVMSTWAQTMPEYRRSWDTHWTQAYMDPKGTLEELNRERGYLEKTPSPITLLVNCNDLDQGVARTRGKEPDPDKFWRDYDHLRACAFLGPVKECNGVWWWWFARDTRAYYTAAQCPKAWADLVRVAQELVSLRPLFNAEAPAKTGSVPVEKGSVEWWLKTVDGKTALIVDNVADHPVTVTVDLPGFGPRTLNLRRYEVRVIRDLAAEPIAVGDRLQVLWDDAVVDTERTTATTVLHHPEFDGVALVLTNAWDNGGGGYRNIFHDGEKYRMYYGAYAIGGTNGNVICCAESKDGLTWTKPSLGICDFRGSKANNIVFDTSIEPGLDNCYVFRDANPNCPPDERYKAVVSRELHLPLDSSQPPGSYLFKFKQGGYAIAFELWFYYSEDGYRFRLGRKITGEGLFDSYNHVFWDGERGEYVCYFRGYHVLGERNTEHKWTDWRDIWQGLKGETHIRDIRRIVSKDGIVWSKPELIGYGADAPDYPMYTNGINPYPRDESLYVGIATRYNERGGGWTPNFDRLPNPEVRKRAIERSPREGLNISDNVFMFSRDGKLFHRVDEAFMTPGPEARRNWCYGDCYVSSGFFPVKGLEGADSRYGIITSVGAKSGEPMALHRYVIRQDGFVSRAAPYRGAKVVTRPIVFGGSKMLLNFSTSGRGFVRVTVRDGKGGVLRSCELFGDRVDREVDFEGSLAAFAGRPVVVEFDMRDAHLYAFRFVSEDSP